MNLEAHPVLSIPVYLRHKLTTKNGKDGRLRISGIQFLDPGLCSTSRVYCCNSSAQLFDYGWPFCAKTEVDYDRRKL